MKVLLIDKIRNAQIKDMNVRKIKDFIPNKIVAAKEKRDVPKKVNG